MITFLFLRRKEIGLESPELYLALSKQNLDLDFELLAIMSEIRGIEI